MQILSNTAIQPVEISKLYITKTPQVHYTKGELEATANVIRRFGLQIPIVIDKENNVIVGENIFLAAKDLGYTQIPAVRIENLSPKEVKAFKIASKRILSFGDFDADELRFEIQDLMKDTDIELSFGDLGFDAIDFDILMFVEDPKEKKESKEKELNLTDIEQVTKSGDLIQLGKHLLYCGDSLEDTGYRILLGDEKADLVITDPPYNVKIQNNVTKRSHDEFVQASGEMTEEEFNDFLQKAAFNLKSYSTEESLQYIFMDWRHSYTLQGACKDVYSKLHNICIWDKTKAGMGSFYRSQHEFCFVYQNGSGKYKNNIQLGSNGRNRSNVWQYQGMNSATKQADKLSKLHPTVKPVSMLMDIMLDASKPNDIVLDCFGGSGSTLIAAEQCGRRARLIEISPHYCDVIIHRWEELTGQKHKVTNIKEIKNGKK